MAHRPGLAFRVAEAEEAKGSAMNRPRTVFGRRRAMVDAKPYLFELTTTGLRLRRKHARGWSKASFSELVGNISGRHVTVAGADYVVTMDPAGVLLHGPNGPACVSFEDLVSCAEGQRLLMVPAPAPCKFCEDDNKAQCGHI